MNLGFCRPKCDVFGLVMLGLLGALQACKAQREASDVNFAVFSGDRQQTVRTKSLPAVLNRTGGTLSLVIMAFQNEKLVPVSQSEADAAAAKFKKAVEMWIAPLKGQEGWKINQVQVKVRTIQPSATGSSKLPCGLDNSGRYYFCDESGEEIRLMIIRQDGFRAHASNSLDFLALQVKNPESVYIHETGHLMGLADTYEEWGYQRLGEQHDRSMMNTSGATTLSNDDLNGVRQIWKFVRTGKMECPAGYRQGGADEASYYRGQKSFLCVRSGTPSRPLCSGKAMRDPRGFDWGNEPDGKSCYIGPSPSRTYKVCSLMTAVNKDGWGYQNGGSCWRPWIPQCGKGSEKKVFLPNAGLVMGQERGGDPTSFCMIRACPDRVQVDASGHGQESGQACISPKGLPKEQVNPNDLWDGYPTCTNLATIYPKDPSWGFEPNGVSCRHTPPNGTGL